MQQNSKESTMQSEKVITEAPKKKSNIFAIVLIMLVSAGAWFGISKYQYNLHHEDTDDAQIEANISPVIPRVAGFVKEVRVKDNQMVQKGDTLLILDDRDLALKVQQAEASLATAEAGLLAAQNTTNASKATIASTQSGIATVDAQIDAAKVTLWRTTQDFNRYDNLIKDHSITQQQFEQAVAAKQIAEKQLQILIQQKNQVSKQTAAVTSQSNATSSQIDIAGAIIKQRLVDVADAKLNLSYAVVVAPATGLVSKVNVQEGQFLQP